MFMMCMDHVRILITVASLSRPLSKSLLDELGGGSMPGLNEITTAVCLYRGGLL